MFMQSQLIGTSWASSYIDISFRSIIKIKIQCNELDALQTHVQKCVQTYVIRYFMK